MAKHSRIMYTIFTRSVVRESGYVYQNLHKDTVWAGSDVEARAKAMANIEKLNKPMSNGDPSPLVFSLAHIKRTGA